MKRSDIHVGAKYDVMFTFGNVVTCRVIEKKLFGFLILCQWDARWDVGYEPYRVYGYKWSWRFIEKF